MKVYIGADHQGYHLKDELFAYLSKRGYDVESVGEAQLDPVDDFPLFAQAVALKVLGSDSADPRGILLCGSGQGMAMAANRFRGIRAAVVWDAHEAKMARHDLDSNVLCLPARIFDDAEDAAWEGVLETWLNTPFSGAVRFMRRNRELDELAS